MLESLYIENIAVVKNVDIELGKGLTILTGETGAGKSIIIDSINLLLGARTSRELVRNGEDKAMVSALFGSLPLQTVEEMAEIGIEPDEDGALFIQRTLSADGRASTKINGRAIPVALQREVGRLLINIHGQHDSQALLVPAQHISILDSYAGIDAELDSYKTVYNRLNEIKKKIDSLKRDAREKEREIELLKYQITDIETAKLKPGEEETLLARRTRIRNYEKIAKQVNTVCTALYNGDKSPSAFELLAKAADALEMISDVFPEAGEFAEKLNEYRYEIEDIAITAGQLASEEYENPEAELDVIEGRLEAISKLKRKYGPDVASIINYGEQSKKRLDEIEMSDDTIKKLGVELDECFAKAKEKAADLTKSRRAAAEALGRQVMNELASLDMGKVVFSAELRRLTEETGGVRYTPNGVDDVEFMIATNPGEPLKPLSKIASGGELSRIMLAIKSVVAGKDNIETLIFDEIDAGVSGKTSQKIGIKLSRIASNCQVICVTHSAQIAALADDHLLITKRETDERVFAEVTRLDDSQRVSEIARIMGGIEITDAILEGARELIAQGRRQIKGE